MTAVALWQPWLHAWNRHPTITLLRPAGSIRHRQYLYAGELAAIDLGLLSVVPALWSLGIDTFASCEACNGPDGTWAYCMVDQERVEDACTVINRQGRIKTVRPSPAPVPWTSIDWQWTT